MKFIYTFLFLLLCLNLSANDGAYFIGGGTIFPMKESKIVMDKEVLSFKVINSECYVTVHFEFFNPEAANRKLLVGFQAPQAYGDVDEESIKYPQIFDFKVSQNNTLLPYQLKTAECEDCPLRDEQTISSNQAGSEIFVYLFEIDFKPGTTVVNHSYRFKASSSVTNHEFYNYILKTGSKWAGQKIKDLTVNIDLGNDTYFYVSDIFGEKSSWSVNGIGKITSNTYAWDYDETSHKMIRILSGNLQIRCLDWNPQQNLVFGIINEHCFEYEDSKKTLNRVMTAVKRFSIDDPEDGAYTKDELKLIRNTFYAQKGYAFTNPELTAYFTKFEWYIPNPNLKMNDISFDEQVKSFIAEIQKREKQ